MSFSSIKDFDGLRELVVIGDCGIYFLVAGDEIIYIGQSVSVHRRVPDHVGRVYFDRAFWIPVVAGMLDATEAAFIRFFEPKENRSVPIADTGLDRKILSSYGLCSADGLNLSNRPLPNSRWATGWRREWARIWGMIGMRAAFDTRSAITTDELMNMNIDTFVDLFRDKDLERIKNFQDPRFGSSLKTVGDLVRSRRDQLLRYANIGRKTIDKFEDVARELGLSSQ